MRRAALLWLAILAGCGGGESGPDAAPADRCLASGTLDPDGPFCDRLSSYGLFEGELGALVPGPRVVPYDINTPLFSDYTVKRRFIYLPEGAAMAYDDTESFGMPAGAVLIKTFAYPADLRDPASPLALLETRLLVRRSDGWDATTYVWDEAGTEAVRKLAGATIAAQWIHLDGSERRIQYSVPNDNQCKNCHEERDDTVGPIGPKARHLHRDMDYGDGPTSQLGHLADTGFLAGLPADLATVPRAPVWSDEATGTLDERARAWLDINCAHCHNPRGAARTSGLDLSLHAATPYEYGVCKPPVAAGGGSGGLQYSIVPGQPNASILVYRLQSTALDERMPELGRQLVDEEGVALIRAWIASLEGSCDAL